MNTRSAISIFLATVLVACASVPHDNFNRIEITAYDPEALIEDASSKGKSVAAGAAVGAAGGLFYTALLSLACGPFYAACFAGAAPAVIGATAVGGGVAGAVSGSRENLDDLKEFIGPMPDSGQLNQELAVAVSELLEPEVIAEPGTGDARLSLGITSLDVRKSWGKVKLQAGARAGFDWKLDQDKPRHATRSYSCITTEESVDGWPENSGELVRKGLDHCILELAQKIHNALTDSPDLPDSPDSQAAGFSETPY